LIRIFKNFGLTEQHSKIYFVLLKFGRLPASTIARKVGMKRSAIYFQLDELHRLLVIKVHEVSGVKYFSATSPASLLQRFEKWTADFSNLVPKLGSLQSVDESAPVVTIRDFNEAHYDTYHELASLPSGSEFRVIQGRANAKADLGGFTNDEWHGIVELFVKNKIITRAIFPDEMISAIPNMMSAETYALFCKRNWQLRSIVEERFPFEEFFIHDDVVHFVTPEEGIIIRIQHRRIARALMSMFDALWLTGKPRRFL